jgi:hypothetical protein
MPHLETRVSRQTQYSLFNHPFDRLIIHLLDYLPIHLREGLDRDRLYFFVVSIHLALMLFSDARGVRWANRLSRGGCRSQGCSKILHGHSEHLGELRRWYADATSEPEIRELAIANPGVDSGRLHLVSPPGEY